VEYKESEQARLTRRMCAALAFLLISKVEGRFMIVKNAPQNEKLTIYLDYYVKQLMEKPECSHRDASGVGIST
jgi:hypothetical protein